MPDISAIMFFLLIIYWQPGDTKPVRVEAQSYVTVEECRADAAKLNDVWQSRVHGGSTSWMCVGAFPDPSA